MTRKLGNLIDHHLVRLVAKGFMILFFNCVSVEMSQLDKMSSQQSTDIDINDKCLYSNKTGVFLPGVQ